MTYEDIIRNNCEAIDPSWWPKYAYHFTDVTNAVSVLSSGYLYSRNEAGTRGVMKNENASRQVIDMTDTKATSFVRFYFRPLTPTQYHNEGYKHSQLRYSGDSGANIPVPVFLLFDLETLLNMKDTRFSELGQAGHGSPMHQGVDAFAEMPFDKIYSDGPCDKETLSYRHAEILYPDIFMLDGSLKGIFCRNVCDRSTLLNMLREEDKPAYYRYKDLIRVARDKAYYRNGLFIESVLFHDGMLSFIFANSHAKNAYANRSREGKLQPVTVSFLFEWCNSKGVLARRMGEVQINYLNPGSVNCRVSTFPKATVLKVTVKIDNSIICLTEQALTDCEII